MAGIVQFLRRFPDDEACLRELAKLKWPNGFVCSKCDHDKGYHLKSRPRVFECAKCGHQNSITAGTVFHKTRTSIHKWFVAAYMIASDARGASIAARAMLSLGFLGAWRRSRGSLMRR